MYTKDSFKNTTLLSHILANHLCNSMILPLSSIQYICTYFLDIFLPNKSEPVLLVWNNLMLQANKFWNKPIQNTYLSYPCSKTQVHVIPLCPRWSQLHHQIISLKCFSGKLSESLCNLISINHKENKMVKQPLLHTLGKQACKMHSLARFVFTFSKSRQSI